jgi:hypothetical protein
LYTSTVLGPIFHGKETAQMRCASACIFTGHEIWSGDSSTRSTVKTGHRIKYAKVDADTGEEVSNEDIMKGYKVDTDTYIEEG